MFLVALDLCRCMQAFSTWNGWGLSLVAMHDFSLGPFLSWSTDSRHESFSSCSTWAQRLRLPGHECTDFSSWDTSAVVAPGTWNLSSAGMFILTAPPALAGGLLSTLPAGKSLVTVLNTAHYVSFYTSFAILIHTFHGCLTGASQVALEVKNPPASLVDAREEGSIPGEGRSLQ